MPMTKSTSYNDVRGSFFDEDDVEFEETPQLAEAASGYFYLCILLSSIGAFLFGCGLGFTSPTMVANKPGKDSACPTVDCAHPSHAAQAWTHPTLFRSPPHVQFSIRDPSPVGNHTPAPGPHTNNHCGNADKMNCEQQFSQSFQSLFGSIINFGCLAGALGGGQIVDKYGKKWSMMIANAIYVVGWALIVFVPSPSGDGVWDGVSSSASNMWLIQVMLVAARLILGLGVGIICCSVSNYQTEICPLSLRGAIGTCFQLFIVIGLFSVYLIGASVTWRTLSWLCLALSFLATGLTTLLVESPVWLIGQKREAEALESLRSLRDCSVGDVDHQFAVIQDEAAPAETNDDFPPEEASGMDALMGDPTSRKALGIGVGLMFVQQLSGINAVMFYSGQIYQSVPGTSSATANTYSTWMQAMQVFMTAGSAFFMDKAGRVPILLFAGSGQCIAAFCLAYYYLFADCTKDAAGVVLEASLGNFPVVSLYAYIFFFSCGMGAIPWFIMGEIFKPSVKGIASSIATAVNWLLSFVITFTVAYLQTAFDGLLKGALPNAIDTGMGGIFTAYGIVCFSGIFFVIICIPETKGLTSREVQHKLSGKKARLARGSSVASNLSEYGGHHNSGFPKQKEELADPLLGHESILNP